MAGNKYVTLASGIDQLLASNNSSAGAGDANKIVSLNASGLIDNSMLPPSSGLTLNATPYTASTVSLTGSEDNILIFDVTSNSITVTLPASASNYNKIYYLCVADSTNTGNTLTVNPHSGDAYNDGLTNSLATFNNSNSPLGIAADGITSWYLLSPDFAAGIGELAVAFGGTGQSSLTNHNVLIGHGSASIDFAAPSATSGVPLISQGSSSDPAFGTAVVAGGGTGLATLTAHNVLLGEGTSNVAFAAPGTAGIPLVSAGATSDPAFGTASVGGGGTGQTSFTVHGVLVGNTTSGLSVTAAGAAGTVLTGNGASDPTFQAPTATPNNIQVKASTNISAGNLVSLFNSSGTLEAALADNTSTTTQADGWAPAAISSGATGTINMFSGPITGLSGLTIGTRYFLGTSGGTTATAPSSSGDLVQPVGIATASTVLQFNAGSVTQIA